MPFSTRLPGRRALHAPGPTPLPDEVLQALTRQPMDLGDARLDAVIAGCEDGLRRLLGTRAADLLLFAANGHGVWEAVVANLIAPEATALVPGTGHFSESWALQAEALGRRVQRTPWHEGEPIDADAVEQALRDDRAHAIAAVFAVHTDTASGTTSELPALRRAIDAAAHPALLVVDAVATLGVEPLAMDALGADVVIGASQKGLMLPPGLGFVALNERAWAVAQANPAPRFYWDFARRRDPLSYRKFCGTPPMNLLYALHAALGLIEAEGLAAVHVRHRRLAGAVRAALAGWAEGGRLAPFCRVPAARSNAVTAIAVAPGVDPDAIRRCARERYQVACAGGLGPLAGRVFRIGHMGDLNEPMVLGAVAGVEAALRELGVAIGDGVTRAVESLVATGADRRAGAC